MAHATFDLMWLKILLEEMVFYNDKPLVLHCDDMEVEDIAKNHVQHERTKHIEVDCYFVREKVVTKEIQLEEFLLKIQSNYQRFSKAGHSKCICTSLRGSVRSHFQNVKISFTELCDFYISGAYL